MSFISDLFKKKPGGTVVGNLLRTVASTVTNGALGTGAGIISQQDFDKKSLDDTKYYAKYGVTKDNFQITPNQPVLFVPPIVQNQALTNPIIAAQNGLMGTWLQRNMTYVILAVVAFGALLVYAFKGKRKRF